MSGSKYVLSKCGPLIQDMAGRRSPRYIARVLGVGVGSLQNHCSREYISLRMENYKEESDYWKARAFFLADLVGQRFGTECSVDEAISIMIRQMPYNKS